MVIRVQQGLTQNLVRPRFLLVWVVGLAREAPALWWLEELVGYPRYLVVRAAMVLMGESLTPVDQMVGVLLIWVAGAAAAAVEVSRQVTSPPQEVTASGLQMLPPMQATRVERIPVQLEPLALLVRIARLLLVLVAGAVAQI
jgi:hypothetical protein